MDDRIRNTGTGARGELLRGALLILLTGSLLGVAHNYLGLQAPRGWGLSWVGQDRVAALPKVEAVPSTAGGADPYYTNNDDPLAVGVAHAALPEIPDIGRPVQIELDALKLLVDAGAVFVADAREADEYAVSHIPGAVHMPYDEVVSDPARLEAIDTGGRPIVTYCGGGSCELSLSLADELSYAGHARVAVFIGGFPEWVDAGYPVDRGPETAIR